MGFINNLTKINKIFMAIANKSYREEFEEIIDKDILVIEDENIVRLDGSSLYNGVSFL